MQTTKRAAAACLLAWASPAAAQESFWRGKTVTILLGGTVGSGIDLSARALARHMGRYLPGNATMNVQLMPGAGGIRLLDHMVTAAPRDGLTLGSLAPGALLEPLVGVRGPTYSLNDFNYIGAGGKDLSLCVASTKSGFRTIEDAKARQMIVAGMGGGSNPDQYPIVINQTLGTKFKLVTGYGGTQATSIAIDRGEADGRCGWSWTSIKGTQPSWVRDKQLNYLLQFGLKKSPEFPDTPLAIDMVTNDADRQLLRLLFAPLSISRLLSRRPRSRRNVSLICAAPSCRRWMTPTIARIPCVSPTSRRTPLVARRCSSSSPTWSRRPRRWWSGCGG